MALYPRSCSTTTHTRPRADNIYSAETYKYCVTRKCEMRHDQYNCVGFEAEGYVLSQVQNELIPLQTKVQELEKLILNKPAVKTFLENIDKLHEQEKGKTP